MKSPALDEVRCIPQKSSYPNWPELIWIAPLGCYGNDGGKNPNISLVVPVYNEEASIDPFLKIAPGVLRETGCSPQIIFIDDGNTDGTLPAFRAAKKNILRFVLYRSPQTLEKKLR